MADQLHFAFTDEDLEAFLTEVTAIDSEIERLNEQKRELVDLYKLRLPLRWVRAALKVLTTRRKLEAHPKEPLSRMQQDALEAMIEQHLERLEEEKQAVPNMV